MDNAKIHHGDEILELVDNFGKACFLEKCSAAQYMLGVRIEYLPPYSPDLNPIEEAFSKIKHWLRRHQEYYGETQGDGILYDMMEVMDIVTPSDASGYLIHAGYF